MICAATPTTSKMAVIIQTPVTLVWLLFVGAMMQTPYGFLFH